MPNFIPIEETPRRPRPKRLSDRDEGHYVILDDPTGVWDVCIGNRFGKYEFEVSLEYKSWPLGLMVLTPTGQVATVVEVYSETLALPRTRLQLADGAILPVTTHARK
jgi:hypothetical protein